MQKVVYGISRVNREEKLKGISYLIDGNLFVPATSSKGNMYIRIFEDVTDRCKPVIGKHNEFKGYVDVTYSDVSVFKLVDHDSDESKEGIYEALDSITVTNHSVCKYSR